ncbi:MAG TPA: hypothetical protein VGF48_25870 [Thermoanaerobaculia bacterium]|jgi:hypothetical protein
MKTKTAIVLSLVTLIGAVAANAAPHPFLKTRAKYRDTSKPSAVATVGKTTLMARALVNADGTADLQLTTGTFEPAVSYGNIDKVQIKSKSFNTINDNQLKNNGTYAINLKAVNRGQTIDVKAHVSGITGRNVDVVDLTETAKLRPDPRVVTVNVPANVMVDTPVIIDATVREANGDVGTRCDCELRVDGTRVDVARGIWVDAGGVVSCSFRHTFASVGAKSVEVALTAAEPFDYNGGNNAATARVGVNAPQAVSLPMPRWSAFATETEHEYEYYAEASWGYRNYQWVGGWENVTGFTASWSNDNLDLSTLRVSYVEKSDGNTIVDLREMELIRNDRAYEGRSPGVQCMVAVTDLITMLYCQAPEHKSSGPGDPARPAWLNAQFLRRSGDVTYFSSEWGKPTPDAPEGDYVKNDSGTNTYGQWVRLGSEMELEVELADATRSYSENPRFTLVTERRDWDDLWRCWNEYWCGEAKMRGWIKDGRAGAGY